MAPRTTPLEVRFWAKVDRSSGPDACWPWLASLVYGYGQIGAGKRDEGQLRAHRVAYELMRGPIPEGLTLDHLCGNTKCVNPAHLEPVTAEENVRRFYRAMTHCKRGHEFTAENTYIQPSTQRRSCRTCRHLLRKQARSVA